MELDKSKKLPMNWDLQSDIVKDCIRRLPLSEEYELRVGPLFWDTARDLLCHFPLGFIKLVVDYSYTDQYSVHLGDDYRWNEGVQ